MKKVFILLGLLTFFLAACRNNTVNFTDIYPRVHVTKIEVTKGNGENAIITNQTYIDEWINRMQSISHRRFNQQKIGDSLFENLLFFT